MTELGHSVIKAKGLKVANSSRRLRTLESYRNQTQQKSCMQHETFGQYPGQKNQTIVNGTNNNYALVESEITDLVLAEGRLEALRSLVLMFLNEIENIKKMLGTKRPRSWGDGIDLEK